MGELSTLYQALNEERKAQHKRWKAENLKILDEYKIPYKMSCQECCMIREKECRADFYPSTGRWRSINEKRTYSGGAIALIDWFEKCKYGGNTLK